MAFLPPFRRNVCNSPFRPNTQQPLSAQLTIETANKMEGKRGKANFKQPETAAIEFITFTCKLRQTTLLCKLPTANGERN